LIHVTHSCDSEQEKVPGSCLRGSEPYRFTQCGKFLDWVIWY
jgi:hypothetical protein